MLKVYRLTSRILTRISNNSPKLQECYDCEKKFDEGNIVVSTTYGNSCKFRCPNCAVKYGVVEKEEIVEVLDEKSKD
jgi:hypothetical protein